MAMDGRGRRATTPVNLLRSLSLSQSKKPLILSHCCLACCTATTYAMGDDVERKVKLAEVALRALLCGLGALAAALVATDSQTRTFFAFQKKAAFTDMKAMVFLVIANGVAAGYSLLQAARCAVALTRGSLLLNKPLAWSIFSCDQALAYVMLAAVAAALQASVIAKRGQPELQWMGICSLYGAFCRQAGGGVASALAAGLAAVLLAFVSAFNLFRLYGRSGGARNGATTW